MKKKLLLLTFSFASCIAFSQIIIPPTGLAKENFNSIGSSATATLPASWKMSSAGSGAASGYNTGTNVTVTTQAASSGTPATGGRYNWATTSGTDRAIGFMSDAGYADGNAIFADYKNATGGNITSVTVSFNVERYRINTSAATVSFFYSTDGTAWTAANSGDISAAVFTPGASSYTFTSPQTVYKNVTIGGLSIANNSDFYLRWVFNTGGTASQGLGLDDVVLFAQAATPVITGSLRDNLQVDNNSNGHADFGDQIRYTTVIRNTGTGDATGVTLTNPTPANTTLNAGSVKTSALARDDSYSTAQNTLLSGSTVLANDFGIPAPTVISFGTVSDPTTTANGANTAKSDNGGTVLMNTDGTFTYTPAAGFAGYDRFAYVATTGTAPDNAGVVTITVGSSVITTGPAENYNVTGNISITTPTSGTGNLLNNDTGNGIAIGSVNGSSSNVGTPITTTNGGTLTVNSDGSFTYNPAPGYEGPDNFTYTVDNGFSNPSAPVTVSLTVAGMIWFIDNNYSGTLTDGRLGSPFKTLAAFQAINDGTGNHPAVSDNIFIYSGGADYTGGITLLDNQKLIGAGATAALNVVAGTTIQPYSASLPATGQPSPVIVNSAGNGVTINNKINNLLRGFDLHNCSGAALSALNFGTLTVSEVSINTTGQALNLNAGTVMGNFPSVSSFGGSSNMILTACNGTLIIAGGNCSTATSSAVSVINGTLNLTTDQNITETANAALLSVSGHSTGTITFQNGLLSDGTGTGLQFDNADGIYNFTGTTALNGGDAGIDILNGSAGTFSFGTGTSITNPSGTAFNIGGTGNTAGVTYSGSITKTNAGSIISITNHATGTVTFQTGTLNATTASTGNGIQFDNADGIYNFNGTTTLNGGTAEVNIIDGSGGTFNFNSNTSISSPADTAFNILGGTATVIYNGSITQASAFPAVSVSQGHATGTVTFNGAVGATNGSGLQFNNADGVYNFNGTTTLNGGDAGIDIVNGSDGSFTFLNAPITNPTGAAFLVNGGSGTIAHTGVISKTSGGRLIDIQSRNGGSVTINGNLSSTTSCTGINVSSCSGGTVTFAGGTKTMNTPGITPVTLATNTGATNNFTNGGLAITSTTANGFNATGGGTVNVTGTGNTITSTTGTALNIANTNIGASGVTFLSISANGGVNGIIADNTGAAGGLTVTGTVGSTSLDNSGGTIQNLTGADGGNTGHGVYLNSTSNVSLNHMNIHNNQGDGIHGNTVSGLTLTYTNMTTNGNTTAQLGNFHGEGDVNLVTLSGSATIDHNNFQLAYYNTFGVFNDVTPVTLNRITMSSNTFGANDVIGGNAGVVLRASGGVMNITFGSSAATANTITGAGSNTFILDMHGTLTSDVIMKNNAISNNHTNIVTGGGGVSLQSGGVGDQVTFTFNVDGNSFSGSHGAGFFIGTGVSHNGDNFTGTFNNNTIGVQATANSGSTTGNDLFIQIAGSTTNISVTNNRLYQYNPNGTGALQLQTEDVGAHITSAKFFVTGNVISNPGTNAAAQTYNGIQLNSGPTGTDAGKTCLTLSGNSVAGSGNASQGSADIRLRQRALTDVYLPGYSGAISDTAAVAAFVVAQNGGGATTAAALVTAGHGFHNACPF